MRDSIYLASAIQADMPRNLNAGTEIRWNPVRETEQAIVEITIRYDSKSPYNAEQGFGNYQITRTEKISGNPSSHLLRKSFFKDIRDGAWVSLSISRTVVLPKNFHCEGQEFTYKCSWVSTDLHTGRFIK